MWLPHAIHGIYLNLIRTARELYRSQIFQSMILFINLENRDPDLGEVCLDICIDDLIECVGGCSGE